MQILEVISLDVKQRSSCYQNGHWKRKNGVKIDDFAFNKTWSDINMQASQNKYPVPPS